MPLVEREDSLASLRGWARDAANGSGVLVFVAAEAGGGKSALARELASELAPEFDVVRGECDAFALPRPLGPLEDIAHAAGGDLARVMRDAADPHRIFRTFLSDLQRSIAPTLVVIEDVHWADEATLDLLRFLGRRVADTRALVMVTYRQEDARPGSGLALVLGDLASAPGVRRLTLTPLSLAGVATLMQRGAQDAAEAWARTGGNPFFLTELIDSTEPSVPPTVRDAVLARASRLGEAARRVLASAAVLGGAQPADVVIELSETSSVALDECVECGMLVRSGDRVGFRHEIAREAVLSSLLPGAERDGHARVVARLRRTGVPPERLADAAHHAEAAGDADAVLEWAPAAASRAATLRAHREAALQYARAVRAAETRPPLERAELLAACSFERYLTDQIDAALAVRHEALALRRAAGDPSAAADDLRWLSRLSWFVGQRADAERFAEDAWRELPTPHRGSVAAMVHSNLAQLAMLANRVDDAVRWGGSAIGLAREAGDVLAECHALNNIGTARAVSGDPEGLEILERSLHIALQANAEEHAARAYANLTASLAGQFAPIAAERWQDEGLAYTTDHDLDAWRLYLLGWKAMIMTMRGRFDVAADAAAEVLRAGRASLVHRVLANLALGLVRARRGDPGAWEALDEGLELAERSQEIQRLVPARLARAEAAWLEGDEPRARAEVAAGLSRPDVGRDPHGALALHAWASRLAMPSSEEPTVDSPWALEWRGDYAAAAEAWEARGMVVQGAMAAAHGPDAERRRAALERLQGLGARAAAARVAQQLRASGLRALPRGPRGGTRSRPHGLTERELDVLEQLAQGLRDAEIAERLFVSPRTVGHHVSSLLAKLEVPSRARAAALAGQVLAASGRPPRSLPPK